MDTLEGDLLIAGGGMAGLTAGAQAASRGARVVLVEKTDRIGGAAVLSGAMFWTLHSVAKLAHVTGGREDLLERMLPGYTAVIDWMRERDIHVSPVVDVMNGQGYLVDIIAYLEDCQRQIEQAEGLVVFESTIAELLSDDEGRVRGGVVRHADGDVRVESAWTLLAAGGLQGDPELRARPVDTAARDMLLRTSPANVGDGVRLGTGAGGAICENPGFYGHLIPEGTPWGEPALFRALAQHHSSHCLLLNEAGARFCDESLFDHVNNQEVLRQPHSRALMVWDAKVHREHVLQPFLTTHETVDKLEVALRHGADAAAFPDLEALAGWARGRGFDGEAAGTSIAAYNQALRHDWHRLSPRREDHRDFCEEAPYYATIVRPAITFSFAGLTIDSAARVLDAAGAPIPGLLAAGADAGDMFRTGYAGGLAQAVATALAAVETAGFGASAPVPAFLNGM